MRRVQVMLVRTYVHISFHDATVCHAAEGARAFSGAGDT